MSLLALPEHIIESIIVYSYATPWRLICHALETFASSSIVKADIMASKARELHPEPEEYKSLQEVHSFDYRITSETNKWANPFFKFPILPRDHALINIPNTADFLDVTTLSCLHRRHPNVFYRLRHFLLLRAAFWGLEPETSYILDYSGANVDYAFGWTLARFASPVITRNTKYNAKMIERLVFQYGAKTNFDYQETKTPDYMLSLIRQILVQHSDIDLGSRFLALSRTNYSPLLYIHNDGYLHLLRCAFVNNQIEVMHLLIANFLDFRESWWPTPNYASFVAFLEAQNRERLQWCYEQALRYWAPVSIIQALLTKYNISVDPSRDISLVLRLNQSPAPDSEPDYLQPPDQLKLVEWCLSQGAFVTLDHILNGHISDPSVLDILCSHFQSHDIIDPQIILKLITTPRPELLPFLLPLTNIHHDSDLFLRTACSLPNLSIPQLLLKHGADVGARQEESLRRALGTGNEALVRLLLDHGASLENMPSQPWPWGADLDDPDSLCIHFPQSHGCDIIVFASPYNNNFKKKPLADALTAVLEHGVKLGLMKEKRIRIIGCRKKVLRWGRIVGDWIWDKQ